ncbi:MAG: DUF4238 domain-containing protein [Bryobacterales bacterium]|nr:DUF4238 domain-containing protein [Bryobacterales bacterium]
MKLSRRHHYLPQMYLRGFADESERVWVFDRKEDKFLHQGILNTAVKKDFYTVVGPDGQKSDHVEQMLANMVEDPMRRIIERLDKQNLTWEGEDRAILALFVALLRTRNPAFDRDQNEFTEQFHRWCAKAMNSSVEAVEETLRKYEQAVGEDMTDVSAQEVFQMIRDDQYEITNPRQNNIKIMLSLALDVAQALFRLNWDILATPKGCTFITCDNPFTVVPPPYSDDSIEGYGILTPGASTIVPLSSKTAICFFSEGDRTRGAVIFKEFWRNTNMVVAGNSDRFVIARDEPLLRSVVRQGKLAQWRRPSQFKMNAPDPYATKPIEKEQPDLDNGSSA